MQIDEVDFIEVVETIYGIPIEYEDEEGKDNVKN